MRTCLSRNETGIGQDANALQDQVLVTAFDASSKFDLILGVLLGALVIALILGFNVRDLPRRRALAVTGGSFVVCCLTGLLLVWTL